MAAIITLNGIEQAISALAYQNKFSLKYKLIHAIKSFLENEDALRTIEAIPSDVLIKTLWDTGDKQTLISKRRKNLSGIRSSINTDLKKLFDEDKNPEGLTISSANIFVMSEEAKDKALKSFVEKIPGGAGASLDEISKIIHIVDELLAVPETIRPDPGAGRLEKLTGLKDSIRALMKTIDQAGAGGSGGDHPEGSSGNVEDSTLPAGAGGQAAGPDEPGDSGNATGPAAGMADDIPAEIEDDELLPDSEYDDDLEELEVLDEIDPAVQAGAGGQATGPDEPGDSGNATGPAAGMADDIPAEIEDDELLPEGIFEDIPVTDDVLELLEDDTASVPPGFAGDESLSQLNPDGHLFEDDSDKPESCDNPDSARFLAEEFNRSLAAMDRFYNQYILIPGGRYIVGSKQALIKDRPETAIQLPDFYIGRYPITNALFEIFIEKTGYATTAEKSGVGTVYYGRFLKSTDLQSGLHKQVWNATLASKNVKGACWYQPSGPGSSIHKKRNHPVVQVSLEDATAFAAWTGKRLPAEDEWEAAARTAAGLEFPWGNNWQKNACNLEESCIGDTTPVDAFLDFGNDLGIMDTLGNVLEWTAAKALSAPENGLSIYHIAKGESWVSGNNIRLSSRFRLEIESHSNILGFRCATF